MPITKKKKQMPVIAKTFLKPVFFRNGKTSRKLVIVVSTDAIIVSRPRMIIIMKKRMAQNGAPPIVVTFIISIEMILVEHALSLSFKKKYGQKI